MEEHQDPASKDEAKGGAATPEKKKSWFSFSSSEKKNLDKKNEKGTIPANSAPASDGVSSTPVISTSPEKKKSWFSFSSGKKPEAQKIEEKIENPLSGEHVEAPTNSLPPTAVLEVPKPVEVSNTETPEFKTPDTPLLNPSPSTDTSSVQDKSSRFGFKYKQKTLLIPEENPSMLKIGEPGVSVENTSMMPAPLENNPAMSIPVETLAPPTPETGPTVGVDPVAQAAIQKMEEKKSRFAFYSRQKDPKKALEQQFKKAQKEEKERALKEQKSLEVIPPGTPRKPEKIKQKKGSLLGSKKIIGKKDKVPQELVHITGNKVLIPTFEEFEKLKNITYPVKEPFQYVNLVEQDGEIVYNAIEPRLTKKERAIHKKVVTAYDLLVNVGTVLVDVEDRVRFLEETYKEIIDIYNIKVTPTEYQRILYFIERDYTRYGRADPLISDRFIEDISCNGPNSPVFVYHRFFESIRTNIVFEELELNNFILRLAQLSGRHISILQPIRDAALPDGSRVNMTLGKEVTKKGSTFTIRKFRAEPISPIEIASLRTATTSELAYLWLLVEYEQSFLISGGTASGKTTLLNAISMLIRPENKIVSVEDTPEINLAHPNWIQAVTRVGFGESSGGGVSGISGLSGVGGKGKSAGDINLYDLLIAALRQRPDYIIVGEVRGEEAYTLFQAISVGHAAMGTVHAASMVELLARIESMPMNVPRVLVANLDIVIFLAAIRRGEEKVRRVREIVEILGLDPGTKELITNTVFRWDPVTDSVEYMGRSFIVEKIAKSFGIPKEDLEIEIKKRQDLLDDLKARGIVNYKEVTEAVRQYYLQREARQAEADARRKLLGQPVEVNAKNSL